MSSLRQIEANRRNAQRSTGPRTPEGRAAVRLNGVQHGLSAKTIALRGESAEDFQALLDSLEAEFQPSTPMQEAVVQDIAVSTWRLRRHHHVEGAYQHMRLEDLRPIQEEYRPGLDDHGKLAYMVNSQETAQTMGNLARYESHIRRSLEKSLQILDRLKAQELRRPEARPDRAGAEHLLRSFENEIARRRSGDRGYRKTSRLLPQCHASERQAQGSRICFGSRAQVGGFRAPPMGIASCRTRRRCHRWRYRRARSY